MILPGMQTDIELFHSETGRLIVIDTKFNRILTGSNYRDKILRSGYLYQMYAYLRTQELRAPVQPMFRRHSTTSAGRRQR